MVDAVYGWSDSQIKLAWIRRPGAHWKVFVANRVQDIHQRVALSQWRFCPGSQNPADLVTRGIPACKLRDCKLWWKGPHWLQQPRSHWPVGEMPKTVLEECLVEARNESVGVNGIVCLATAQENIPALALRYVTLATLGMSNCMDPKVVTFTWTAEEREAVCRGIKGN